MKKLIALIALFMFAAVMSYASESLSADGTDKAKIIQDATLTHEDGALDFGVLIRGTSQGTATVQPAANPAPTYSIVKPATGATSADHFTLANLDTDTEYSVSVPAGVTLSGPSSSTMAATLTKNIGATVSGVSSQDIYIGGTLTVASDQTLGEYEGTYTITVTY